MDFSRRRLHSRFPRCSALAVALFLSTTVQPCLSSQEVSKAGVDNPQGAVRFCRALQQAVKAKEKAKIARWVVAYPIQVEYTPFVHPTGQRGSTQSILILDEEDFVENFDVIFNFDVTRKLFSNTGCELAEKPEGSARIANGVIEIDQHDNGDTVIQTISAPANYEKFYEDDGTYDLGAKNFLTELKQALTTDDRNAVARLCRYPLQVNSPNDILSIKNRKDLVTRYAEVFTPKVKQAVLQLKAPIMMGWRGFMTEHGEVWFDLVVGTNVLRVGTINVP